MKMKSDNMGNTHPHYITALQLKITTKASYKQGSFIIHCIHIKP